MPRASSIANHPQRTDIEREILNGTSYRNISKRYGMSPAAITRYRADVLGPIAPEVAKVPKVISAKDRLIDATIETLNDRERFLRDSAPHLSEILSKQSQLLGEAEEKGDLSLQQSILRDMARTITEGTKTQVLVGTEGGGGARPPAQVRVILVGEDE